MLKYGPPKRIGNSASCDHADKREGDEHTSHVNVTKTWTFILFIMFPERLICFGELKEAASSSSSSFQSAPLTPKASPNS